TKQRSSPMEEKMHRTQKHLLCEVRRLVRRGRVGSCGGLLRTELISPTTRVSGTLANSAVAALCYVFCSALMAIYAKVLAVSFALRNALGHARFVIGLGSVFDSGLDLYVVFAVRAGVANPRHDVAFSAT